MTKNYLTARTYKAFTDRGYWLYEAQDDIDAMRLALYYCYRDGEQFRYLVRYGSGGEYVVRIVTQCSTGREVSMTYAE